MNMLVNAGGLGQGVGGFDECVGGLGEYVDGFDECVGGLW